MKKQFVKHAIVLCIIFCSSNLIAEAQAPNIQWQKAIGGSADDANNFGKITVLKHGGYLLVGSTFSTDGDFSSNTGDENAFIVKFNSSGNIIWERTYGGSAADILNGVVENSDGTFMIGGYTYSNDGDVSGNHGDKDAWVIKISANGTLLSQHCYGGSGEDMITDMIKTSGNTCTFSGWTTSVDGDVNAIHGDQDAWVAKIKSNYDLLWSKTYGGSAGEALSGLMQAGVNKILIVGFTGSSDGDMNGYHGGDNDAFAMSLDQNGNINWSKCYGGSGDDYSGFGIGVAKDGNLLIPGTTNSNDGDVTGNHGMFDGWITKINNNNGSVKWSKCYGTALSESGFGMLTMPDGDLVLLGISGPSNDFFGDALSDALVTRISSNGNQKWSKTYGGSDFEDAEDGVPTSDGGMILLNHTLSADGDVTNQHGGVDIWLVKLDCDGHNHNHRDASFDNNQTLLSNYPNPFSTSTTITFSVPELQRVSLKIYDMNGKLVSTLADQEFETGENRIEFNADNLDAGIYFLKMQAGDFLKTEKLIVTK